MENLRRKRIGCVLYAAVVVLAAAAVVLFGYKEPELVEYKTNVWFSVSPEGMIDSNGNAMTTWFRVGSERKTIILFCGGGLSIDEYTASHPYSLQGRDDAFYSDDGSADLKELLAYGILNRLAENPFRDWNIIAIAYSTADFHVGDSEYAYTTLDGEQAVLYHHGYKNYQAVMTEALRYVPDTEELLICGYSAGGYAAVMLADDILENYYPDAERVSVCVDSSLLLSDDWDHILRDVWNVPESIADKVQSDNPIVDGFAALYEEYGDFITCLYAGSVRDGELARYQSYFDRGVFESDTGSGLDFSEDLADMVARLQESVPGMGFYLFEDLPYFTASMEQYWFSPEMFGLTQHTILPRDAGTWPLVGGTTALNWLYSAVHGDVASLGLSLLN